MSPVPSPSLALRSSEVSREALGARPVRTGLGQYQLAFILSGGLCPVAARLS